MRYGQGSGPVLGPVYDPDQLTIGDPNATPLGPEYNPTELFIDTYKWWLIGGGIGLFLLAGGSVLGISLKRRKGTRR